MNVADAVSLIAPAVRGSTWADLGAGSGTFTVALASLLGPSGQVHAVERDPAGVVALRELAERARDDDARATIIAIRADFTRTLTLPVLDGVLLANALHFVPAGEQSRVLGRIAGGVRPGGRVLVVEYEGRRPSRWVPFPISLSRLHEIARDAGLAPPTIVASHPSAFGGTIYAAYAER
jgi:SAM-dependent methyltransferase